MRSANSTICKMQKMKIGETIIVPRHGHYNLYSPAKKIGIKITMQQVKDDYWSYYLTRIE